MNILGIHLDPPYLRISLVRKRGRSIEIRETKVFSLNAEPEGRHENRLSPEEAIKQFLENFKGKVASGLLAKDFILRSVETKVTSSKHIEEAIRFQSEATSHFDPENIITVPFLIKKEPKALLFTVIKEGLKEHLEAFKKLEIDPHTVSTVPNGLCHFINWKFPKLDNGFVVDLGTNEVTCALMEKGRLKRSHAIPFGIAALLDALLEDRKKILLRKEIEGAAKQIDLLILKPGLNPNLSSLLKAMRQKIEQTYHSYARGVPIPVIFTGRSDAFLHLREFLMDFSEEFPLSQEEQLFAVSSGLAIEQMSKYPMQLRQGAFFPEKNWFRMGLYALGLITLSTLLSVGLVLWGNQTSFTQTQTMLQASLPSEQSMEAWEVEEKIDGWISTIEKNNKKYPYILQAPRVSEFLSWLSTHPLINELKLKNDPIEILEIRYTLEKYPSAKGKKDPFLAKVELEFSFKSAMNARRFHDLILKGDHMINPKLDITWDVQNDTYRTSFYLKNGRPYVP